MLSTARGGAVPRRALAGPARGPTDAMGDTVLELMREAQAIVAG